MSRSFDLVDDKLFEADFFLTKLSKSGFNMFAFRCYFSAFVSSARSVTFVLQAVMKECDGFQEWYEVKQAILRSDPLARFFVDARNQLQKTGVNLVTRGCAQAARKPKVLYFFEDEADGINNIPKVDVVSASKQHMTNLARLVLDCYEDFSTYIDPEAYYTSENLHKLGLSVEDVEEQFGFPRGWTDVGMTPSERLSFLRSTIPTTGVDQLLYKYLKRTRSYCE